MRHLVVCNCTLVSTNTASPCPNRQLCINCATITTQDCVEDISAPSAAEECLARVGPMPLVGFDQQGTCRAYFRSECMEMYHTGKVDSRTFTGGWAARRTCTTSQSIRWLLSSLIVGCKPPQ